jgi:Tfp pilus assembly protein PilN
MRWNPLETIGTGIGLEIRGADLAVAVVKSRWKGAAVLASGAIRDFRGRPAAEWGGEYEQFLKAHRVGDLPATLALPRHEAIVRLLHLPAGAGAELASAVRFQVDALHPYGEENVYFGFAPLERPDAAGTLPVAVVIAAREVVDGYADLFAEAGVKLRGMTVVAACFYGASRLLRRQPPAPFLLVDRQNGHWELYGESGARPLLSAAFDAAAMPLDKAVAAAVAELRLPEDTPAPVLLCGASAEAEGAAVLPAGQVLGSPVEAPEQFELQREAGVFATALAAACPRWGWRLNLLPRERRTSSARWPLIATGVAAAAAILVALLLWLRAPVQDRRYARELEREIRRLEAVEREVRGLEQQVERARARRRQLENFRRRPEADLALITEVSRRLPDTVWLNLIEVNEDTAQLAGEADAAAPLLGLLDSSGVLTGSAFAASIARVENREVFRIRAARQDRGAPPPASPAGGAPPNPPGGSALR